RNRKRIKRAVSDVVGLRGRRRNWSNRGTGFTETSAGVALASSLGPDCCGDCVDCATRARDGDAIAPRPPSNRQRRAGGYGVVLGIKRHYVGDWIGDDGLRRAHSRIPGGDVDGQRLLPVSCSGLANGVFSSSFNSRIALDPNVDKTRLGSTPRRFALIV